MKAKEAMVRRSAFPKPPTHLIKPPVLSFGLAHANITEEMVAQALMTQAATKAPGPDKINFQILQMIWCWDKTRITNMVYHAVRLGYHPREWKKARGILLKKGGKRDFGLVRSYRVISLLNCMGKVVEKVVAKELSQYCEEYFKLHPGQMGGRKDRSAIDAVAMLVHTVQEKWEQKKLAAALFMDVKGAFDHVSKRQLLRQMIELGIDGDLVTWTESFLTDRKVQLVIDGHENKEREIETGIPQGSPVSPILFLIYISGVFNKVSEINPWVTSLSFIDDLGFIASGNSVKEVVKTLENVAKAVLEWGKQNAVTYDVSKTEAVLFSKSHRQRLSKQLREAKIKVGDEKISFNKEATRWLGIWLDSQLKFTSHINERVKRARTAEILIKGLTKTHGLVPGLVRRIQLSVVQSTALYGAELWWKGQKNHEQTIQQMLSRQARSITGMYLSTPIHPLLCEAGLTPASIILDTRQRLYGYRLLSLPDKHPTKKILPISLRTGDGTLQPEELPESNLMWTQNARPTLYGQWLAWQITVDHSIDPADGVEPVEIIKPSTNFVGKVIIDNKTQALKEGRKNHAGLTMWTDGSKLSNGRCGAAVCWKDIKSNQWRQKSVFLGKNKETLDVELWAISEALDTAMREILTVDNTLITIFCDSQKALTTIRQPPSQKENRFLRGQIYYKAKKLKTNGHMVVCRWIPGHTGLIGNEKADLAARNKAEKGGKQAER